MDSQRIVSYSTEPFAGRAEAGQLLAGELNELRVPKPVVLGIPRGGVIVAQELAKALAADLDVVLTHKLRAPENPELAIGAVSEDGTLFVEQTTAQVVGAGQDYIDKEKTRQLTEMARRVERYRQVLPRIPLAGRIVILTDDGVATGATTQAALWSIRQEKPQKVIAAFPVGPQGAIERLSNDADQIICLRSPPYFQAIGQFYVDFEQVDDEEVLQILTQERQRRSRQ